MKTLIAQALRAMKGKRQQAIVTERQSWEQRISRSVVQIDEITQRLDEIGVERRQLAEAPDLFQERRRRLREIIEHPGAVAILPWVDEHRVCLIRNRRAAVGATLLELPAGTFYSAVAHLTDGGMPVLSFYENDLGLLRRGRSRLVVRHDADAPSVDGSFRVRSGDTIFHVCPRSDERKSTLAPAYSTFASFGEFMIGKVHWKRYFESLASCPMGFRGQGSRRIDTPVRLFCMSSTPE